MQNDKEKFKILFKKRLYDFTLRLIKFVDSLPKDNTSQILSKQLIRSGTSIIANYVEAQASSSRKDFTNFFNYSLKSANESKLWIALLRDSDKTTFLVNTAWFLEELNEISKILGSSILTLRGKK